VLALSSDLEEERLERALRALEPTAIVLCGPSSADASAASLMRRIRGLGIEAPLYAFRIPSLVSEDGIPVADAPSQITQALNTDLRRRAAYAFA
jgi:hypothetical protein